MPSDRFRLPSVAVLALLVVAGCTPKVQFSEPMPPNRPNLPNIPKAFRGIYLEEGMEEAIRIGKDTVWMDGDVFIHGEDFLLRKMAGHLVWSQPVEETGHWEVFVFPREGKEWGFGHFGGMDGGETDEFIRRMSTLLETTPQRMTSPGTPGHKYHLISPTSREFRTILKEEIYRLDDQKFPLAKGETVTASSGTPPPN